MDASRERWQRAFDKDFPDGLIMRWDDGTATRYVIPRVDVVGVPDQLPIVRLDVLVAQKSFVAQITGYTVVRRRPTYARVVAEGYDRLMLWDGDIPDHLKQIIHDPDW